MTSTTTTTAKKTSKIGASVTCSSCGLTYGDHHYLCPNDAEGARFLEIDRRTLARAARAA